MDVESNTLFSTSTLIIPVRCSSRFIPGSTPTSMNSLPPERSLQTYRSSMAIALLVRDCWILKKTTAQGINKFIKRDVKKKFSSTEVEKILVSRSSPPFSAHRFRSTGFALACLPFLWVSSFAGDDANRVLKLGKRTWSWSVNHGSIGGSWPIAISGYPRRHTV